ncbi:MAG: hypothetical protein CMK92_06240 [Pseudomonas sp.]|nr:hypothetical protein [Pseudomonas sp.]|tara:strand:- start:14 stop:685 length:672 start_codon:yes stop_codon:yes gene_type:complete
MKRNKNRIISIDVNELRYGDFSIFRIVPEQRIELLTSSREWVEIRRLVLSVLGRRCLACNAIDSFEVDHIYPVSIYPDKALSVSNLQVLCSDCNSDKSNKTIEDFRSEEDVRNLSHLSKFCKKIENKWRANYKNTKIKFENLVTVKFRSIEQIEASKELTENEHLEISKIVSPSETWFKTKRKIIRTNGNNAFNYACRKVLSKDKILNAKQFEHRIRYYASIY